MNTLTYAALGAFLVAGSIFGVAIMDKASTQAVTLANVSVDAALSAQERYIDASLRQVADTVCPTLPDTPLYAEARAVAHCARYGH
jgi:hypothetical protein